MSIVARRIILPFVSIVVLWAVVVLAVSFSVETLFGIGVSERLTPFSNVHLMEEASEGTYDPLADWLFLAFRAFVALAAFGVGTAFAAAGASGRQLLVAVVPAFLAIVLMLTLLSYAWDGSYPHTMRMAFFVDLLMCVGGSAAGLALGSRLKWPGRATDG
jgi:hypothetical protein